MTKTASPGCFILTARTRNHHRWETLVIVYGPQEGESPSCENPNQTRPIVGYATIVLTDVRGAPDKTLIGQILCELVDNEPNRGGGGNYGTMGSIPGLVE